MTFWLASACALGALPACKSQPGNAAAASSSAALPSSIVAAGAPAAVAPVRGVPRAMASPPALPVSVDGGAGCRLLRGPIELPLRSPPELGLRGDNLEVIQNDDGRPRALSFPIVPVLPPTSAPPAPELNASPAAAGYAVPCAFAGERVFCADHTGAVHRAARDGSGDRVAGSSRAGSRLAASPLAGSHTALGYLASRQTTEGWTSEAWLVVDDEAPVRLSEDGSGATSLALAPRGEAVLALTVDARAALTAMHARPITFDAGARAARLGEDAVVFVGGPGDRRTRGALLLPGTHEPAFALLPIAKDVSTFGLALVRLDDPPRVDEPVSWSMYENGLDPAPIAATTAAGRSWAARVVPRDASPGSARVLELGSIDAEGGFSPYAILPTTGKPADVSLVGDPGGALWLAWVDAGGSWLERLACPPVRR